MTIFYRLETVEITIQRGTPTSLSEFFKVTSYEIPGFAPDDASTIYAYGSFHYGPNDGLAGRDDVHVDGMRQVDLNGAAIIYFDYFGSMPTEFNFDDYMQNLSAITVTFDESYPGSGDQSINVLSLFYSYQSYNTLDGPYWDFPPSYSVTIDYSNNFVLKASNNDNLFDGGANDRDLNALDAADFDDPDATRALGGNDVVRLPDTLAKWQAWGVSGVPAFLAGEGDDRVLGRRLDDIVHGEAGNDRLSGGAGNDTLDGGNDNDRLEGGVGNDLLTGGEGNDVLDGGDDRDRLDGGNGSDTLIGGSERDVLVGGADDDVLVGYNGMPTASGLAPEDRDTVAYRDALYGGDGNDVLWASWGDDRLEGGGDNDTLVGGRGADTLNGGDGDDILVAYLGGPLSVGAPPVFPVEHDGDANTLRGGTGIDSLHGSDGNDVLDGGADSDTIWGGAGNDILIGAETIVRVDRLDGGAGDDDFLVGDGDIIRRVERGEDVVLATMRAPDSAAVYFDGRTTQLLAYTDTFLPSSIVTISEGVSARGFSVQLVRNGFGGIDGVGFRYDQGLVGSAVDRVAFDPRAARSALVDRVDEITVDFLTDALGALVEKRYEAFLKFCSVETVKVIAGYAAKLNIGVKIATTSIDLGELLIDWARGELDTPQKRAGAIAEMVLSAFDIPVVSDLASGAIKLGAALVEDLLNSWVDGFVRVVSAFSAIVGERELPPDYIYVPFDAAAVTGTSADDKILVNGLNGGRTIDGGSGSDVLSYTEALSPGEVAPLTVAANSAVGLRANLATGTIVLPDGSIDKLVSIERLIATEADDILYGDGEANLLGGGDGADTLAGAAGDDILWGGAAADRLSGGDGNDEAVGNAGDDYITGGNGDDLLHGGAGRDRIHGQDGDDRLEGGDDADRLVGGAGTDLLFGGDAADRIAGDDGRDTLLGGAGNDSLYGGNDNDSLDGGLDNDRLFGDDGEDRLIGGMGNDSLNGGAGNDKLYGDAGDDRLFGGLGNDSINGGIGNDRLYGADGRDNLSGSLGNDLLQGDGGADSLWGGAGADKFVFIAVEDSARTSGIDTIVDFSAAQGDRIDLRGIDASTAIDGNQAFVWIGKSRFSDTAGELRFGSGRIEGDIDGDGAADLLIRLAGVTTLDPLALLL